MASRSPPGAAATSVRQEEGGASFLPDRAAAPGPGAVEIEAQSNSSHSGVTEDPSTRVRTFGLRTHIKGPSAGLRRPGLVNAAGQEPAGGVARLHESAAGCSGQALEGEANKSTTASPPPATSASTSTSQSLPPSRPQSVSATGKRLVEARASATYTPLPVNDGMPASQVRHYTPHRIEVPKGARLQAFHEKFKNICETNTVLVTDVRPEVEAKYANVVSFLQGFEPDVVKRHRHTLARFNLEFRLLRALFRGVAGVSPADPPRSKGKLLDWDSLSVPDRKVRVATLIADVGKERSAYLAGRLARAARRAAVGQEEVLRLYRSGQIGKAWQKLQEGEGAKATCDIPSETVHRFWQGESNGSTAADEKAGSPRTPLARLPAWTAELKATCPPVPSSSDNVGAPITEEEVTRAIARTKRGSSPGYDGISNSLMRILGKPFVAWLTPLLEWCRTTGVVLEPWKHGVTTLIYKKGDRSAPKNWRPITLLSCVSKLYSGILDRRLHDYDKMLARRGLPRLFSASQRGFRPGVDGCHLNTEVVKSRIEHWLQGYITYVDFSNAFGSMDHAVFVEALEWLNVPEYFRAHFAAAYSGASYRIRLGSGGLSEPVVLSRGCPQGQTISPTAFALFLEPLLRRLSAIASAQAKPGQAATEPTYADDIALVATTKALATKQLNAVAEFANHTGMMVNAEKCVSHHFTRRGNVVTQHATKLYIGGKLIPSPLEPFKYLGHQVGGDELLTTFEIVRDNIAAQLKLLDAANLPGDIKQHFFVRHVLPFTEFRLSGIALGKGQLERLDRTVRKYARKWDALPPGTANAFMHLPLRAGGIGVPELAQYAYYWRARTQLRALASSDAQVRAAATLRFFEDTAAVLGPSSSRLPRDAQANIDRILAAPSRIRSNPNLAPLVWLADALGASLRVYTPSRNEPPSVFLVSDSKECSKDLLKAAWDTHVLVRAYDELQKLSQQGQGSISVPRDQVWSEASFPHMRHPELFTVRQRRFQIKAQAGSIACASNMHRWKYSSSPACTQCGCATETTLHVLNGCPTRLNYYSERHDAVLKVLTCELSQGRPGDCSLELRVDQAPNAEVVRTNQRPDIIQKLALRGGTPHVTNLVDLKCPFPQADFLSTVDSANLTKYEHIRAAYQQQTAGRVNLRTLIIPSVGPVPVSVKDVLTELGIRARSCAKVARLMAAAAVKANAKLQATVHPA